MRFNHRRRIYVSEIPAMSIDHQSAVNQERDTSSTAITGCCSLRLVWVPGRESYTLASGDTARIQRQTLRSASSTDVMVVDSRISGRRSSGMERVTAQCHLGAVVVVVAVDL